MYRRTKQYIKSSELNPNIFIEDNDYSNSELLYKIDKVVDFQKYTITKYEHRIDLISKDIYNDIKYSWVLMFINRISIAELVRGRELMYIPKNKLVEIIGSV